VTFSQVDAVFSNSCTGNGVCHGVQDSHPLKLQGDSVYENIVDAAHPYSCTSSSQYVVPANVEASFLHQKLLPSSNFCGGGNQMPLGSTLMEEDRDVIRDWICQGATPDQ